MFFTSLTLVPVYSNSYLLAISKQVFLFFNCLQTTWRIPNPWYLYFDAKHFLLWALLGNISLRHSYRWYKVDATSLFTSQERLNKLTCANLTYLRFLISLENGQLWQVGVGVTDWYSDSPQCQGMLFIRHGIGKKGKILII